MTRRTRIGVIQVICAAAGAVLGLLVPLLPVGADFSATTALQIMLTIGFGVLGLVAVIFSLLFTVVQWVYGTFSMRLRLFDEQQVTWWVFGLSIGVFVYTLVASAVVATQGATRLIVPGVAFAGMLVVIVLLRRMQLVAFASVQLGPTVQQVASRGLAAQAVPSSQRTDPGRDWESPPGGTDVAWPGPPGVLQEVDLDRLARDAARAGSLVEVTAPPGSMLAPGRPFARVRGDLPVDQLRRRVHIGASRTFGQDPLLGVRLLADVALRALSSAVNDPATAVAAIDLLEVLLVDAASRDLGPIVVRDGSGDVRVVLHLPTWDDFLHEGLADLVQCASALPTPAARVTLLLARLQEAAPADRSAAVGTVAAEWARVSTNGAATPTR